jgi:hypothetical protein
MNRPPPSPLAGWLPLRSGDAAVVVADFPSSAAAHSIADQLRAAGVRARLFAIPAGEPLDPPSS